MGLVSTKGRYCGKVIVLAFFSCNPNPSAACQCSLKVEEFLELLRMVQQVQPFLVQQLLKIAVNLALTSLGELKLFNE